MSSPFPLLRLPRLALCEVFKSLSIGEKIQLSLCSKKVSIQIMSSRLYSQKVLIDLNRLHHKIRVHFENDIETFEIFIYPDYWISSISNIQNFSIACSTARVMSIGIGIRTYWKNHQEGFLSVIQHLLKMFPCKISTNLTLINSDLCELTISEFLDQQMEFKALTIQLNQNMLFKQISSNLGQVEDLRIISFVNPGVIPVFTSWPQSISIWCSDWFTLESLLACTCQKIILEESSLENKDLDEILRKWRAGELPNLKRLTISSMSFTDNGEHILGMNLRELNGMVIQTDDGSKKATIALGSHCIEITSVIPTNDEDQTMIESHELLSMACDKYKEEKSARDKEPRLRYTTMQMSLIGHLCDVVRKELNELKRAEEQKKRIKK